MVSFVGRLRALMRACSIDPIGCEDVDDALCVQRLPNGNMELSVHIADVSFFVKPGTYVYFTLAWAALRSSPARLHH